MAKFFPTWKMERSKVKMEMELEMTRSAPRYGGGFRVAPLWKGPRNFENLMNKSWHSPRPQHVTKDFMLPAGNKFPSDKEQREKQADKGSHDFPSSEGREYWLTLGGTTTTRRLDVSKNTCHI
jgi:hypothetical protein